MPVQVQHQPNDTYLLRISGILKRSEFGAEQTELARHIDTGSGAGVRRAPVKFFPPNELEQARSWLAE